MTNPLLVGVAGKDGVGKSTLAGTLATHFGDAAVVAFASKLREMCVVDGFLSREEAYTKPTSDKAREVLRNQSQLYKKAFGDLYFVRSCQAKWRRLLNLGMPVLVHDLRYLAEAEAIHEDGGVLVLLGSSQLTGAEREQDSFADLPKVCAIASYALPKRPGKALVSDLFAKLLKETV